MVHGAVSQSAWRGLLPATLLAALLGGCASTPPPPAVASPHVEAQHLVQRSLNDPGLHQFLALQTGAPRAADRPWNATDLGLAALYFRPTLRLHRAEVALAEADLQTARQLPNPSLDLGLKYGAADVLAAPSPWTVGAAIGLLLVSHAQRHTQTAQAEAGVRAARLLLRNAGWTVCSAVRRAFVQRWAARRQAQLQTQVLDTALALQGRIAARAQAGWDAPLAAAQAQEAAQRAALQLAADRGAVQQAQTALAAAVGLPVAALQTVALDDTRLDTPAPQLGAARLAHLRQAALTHRFDVRAAWQRVQVARAGLQLAQTQRDGGPPRLAPGGERDQGVNRLTLAARVPLPLFNQHQGQIAAAQARLARAQATLEQVQARALATIDQAEAALRSAQQRHAEAVQLRDADAALLQADRLAQHRGLLGSVTVLRARLRALASAQVAQQTAAAQWLALDSLQTALQHALARPTRSDTTAPAAPQPSPLSPRPDRRSRLASVAWQVPLDARPATLSQRRPTP